MPIRQFLLIYFLVLVVVLPAQTKYLTLTSPLKNENLIAGHDFNITWSSINVKSIRIEYSLDGGSNWLKIIDSTDAIERQFLWSVPQNTVGNILVRISDIDNTHLESISKANINILKDYEPKIGKINDLQKFNSQQATILKIMPLGNSITRGIIGSTDETGYRRKLYQLLINSNYNINFIGSQSDGIPIDFDKDHEGHGGWSASQPSNRSKSLLDSVYKFLTQNKPNVILLHIGTNDIARLSIEGANIFNVVSEVEQILDTIDLFEQNTSSEIIVFLAKIIDSIDDPTTSSVNEFDTTKAFNLEIETMINNRISSGDNIILVDQESALNYPSDLIDGVHPNDIGYEKMATKWYDGLLQILPVITKSPVARGGLIGDSVVFEVTANSSSSLNYQWQKDGVNISGATTRTYTFNNIKAADDGAKFRCLISNIYGEVLSSEAELFVTETNTRVQGGQLVLYDFNEGSGNFINDNSNNGAPLNLTINTPGSINWFQEGIEVKSAATISSSTSASKIYTSCTSTNEITIEVWLSTEDESQSGPARILTMSSDASNRNFSLLQDGDEFSVQLRTTSTNNNGIPSIWTNINSFADSLLQIVYTRYSNGTTKLFVNGIESSSSNIPGIFSNWNPSYSLGLANEFTDSRNWLGKFYLLSIFDRALSSSEISNNYNVGLAGITELQPPSNLQAEIMSGTNINLQWNDNTNTEIGFIVERSIHNADSFSVIDSLGVNITNYLDANLLDGASYFYRVRAYNSITESSPSNSITKTLTLTPPNNLFAELNISNQTILTWMDNSESETEYIIEGKADHIDSNYIELGSVSSNVTSYLDSTPKYYSPYKYRVYAVSQDTISDYSNEVSLNVVGVLKHDSNLPEEYALFQNYPNPFNPTTIITYSIPVSNNGENSQVLLKIFNNLGKELKILVNKIQNPGNYKISANLAEYPSGIYFYQLKTQNFVETKKMLLLK